MSACVVAASVLVMSGRVAVVGTAGPAHGVTRVTASSVAGAIPLPRADALLARKEPGAQVPGAADADASVSTSPASSLGPPPRRDANPSCKRCVWDPWTWFTVVISPHVVRVGQVLTATVTDPTNAYLHSWSWMGIPGGEVQPGCDPAPDKPVSGPFKGGHCSWKMTEPTEGWKVPGVVAVSAVGEVFGLGDYYAVLDGGTYLLHGYVRNADGSGVGGARVTFMAGGEQLATTSYADGYYDAVLHRASYRVSASKPGLKLCAAQRSTCENPTVVNMVSDKELDFGPPGAFVVQGDVHDHRGRPLARAEVAAVAVDTGARTVGVTDASGAYRLKLDAGAYNVRVVPVGKTDRERYIPPVAYVVRSTGSVTEDFELAPADLIDLSTSRSQLMDGKSWTTVPASGWASVQATVSVQNGRGDPVADLPVDVDPPRWDGQPEGMNNRPEVLMCDAAWRRVYPGSGLQSDTGPDGSVAFHIFFGTVLGDFFLRSRETGDHEVFGVQRFGQLGTVGEVRPKDIVTTLDDNQGIGPPPGHTATAAALQDGLVAWLINRLAADNEQSRFGFAPIRNKRGTVGAIVFYPSGEPLLLRAHLLDGMPLSVEYHAFVLPIENPPIPYGDAEANPRNLIPLEDWEKQFGPAQYGFLAAAANQDLVFLGFPYPPAATDPQRASFDQCVPDTEPLIIVQANSALSVQFSGSGGRRFDVGADGQIVRDQLGGSYVPAHAGIPNTYILPVGSYSATVTGSGAGPASLVVSSSGTSGDRAQVFSLCARKHATGTLALSPSGAPAVLRFGGTTVRADVHMTLLVRGLPARLLAGRPTTLTLRALSQFGAPVPGALVTLSGNGPTLTAETDSGGLATLRLTAPRRSGVCVRVSMPGYAAAHTWIAISANTRQHPELHMRKA